MDPRIDLLMKQFGLSRAAAEAYVARQGGGAPQPPSPREQVDAQQAQNDLVRRQDAMRRMYPHLIEMPPAYVGGMRQQIDAGTIDTRTPTPVNAGTIDTRPTPVDVGTIDTRPARSETSIGPRPSSWWNEGGGVKVGPGETLADAEFAAAERKGPNLMTASEWASLERALNKSKRK